MAYNTKKGSQHSGDIQYEGDPNDTQIDFENDSIGLKTGGATRVLVTDTGLSGSAGLQTVGAAILGSTLNVSGTINSQVISATGISGSGTLQTVGATTLGSSLTVSGNVSAGNDGTGTIVDFNCAEDVNAFRVRAVGAELVRIDSDASNGNSYFRGKARFGSHTVAPTSTVSVTGDISGSGALQAVGATILGSTLNVSGASILNGVSGSGTLQAVGATTLGSTLNVSGATTLAGDLSGSGELRLPNAYISSGGMLRCSGSISSSHAVGVSSFKVQTAADQIFLGVDTGAAYWPAGESYIINYGHYSGSKSLVVGGPISGSGTLFMSGTISGAAELQAVGATTLGSTLNVSGVVTAPSITGSMGLYSLANGTLQVGHEEVGTGVAVKISTTSDNSVPMLVKTPSHEILFAVTGSGKVLVGGMHLDAKLNISGSDVDKLISAAGTSRGPAFYVSASGETFVSGSVILQDVEPTIYFSGSNGSETLGQIGYNSSDNILIQNNVTNKHIVLKANDAGTLREGFRLDGAVPEVVVNQTADSLVDFRVESDNNTHMLFVDGAADKIGINTDTPGTTLDINGSAIRIRNNSTPSSASDLGMTGEIRWDANYVYICIATDTWRRIAHSTW